MGYIVIKHRERAGARATAVVFFAFPATSCITGATLRIDDGTF
jgi:hypothetical protein